MSEALSGTITIQQEARRIWLTVLIGVILCFGVVMVMPSTYAAVDDLGVQMVLAGEDGFAPAAEVPFLSLTLNYVLLFLYRWIPAVSWYGLLLVTTQAVGLSLLFYSLIAKIREIPWLGLVFPFFLIFSVYTLLMVTFTQATLTLIFGVAAVIASRYSYDPWPVKTRRGLALLLLWALLWRWKFGIYCLVFFAPLVVVQLHQLRQYLGLLLIVLSIVACDRIVNHMTASPVWKQYIEFYDTRAKLFDMPGGRVGGDLTAPLEAAGWNENDYRLIRDTWMLYDENLVSKESMNAFMNAVALQGGATITEQIENNLRENSSLLKAFLPIGIAIVLLGIRSCLDDPLLLRKLLAVTLFIIPVLFLAYFRLKPRILVPIFLYGFCLLNTWMISEETIDGFAGWGQKVNLTWIHFVAFIPIVIGLGGSWLVVKQQWDDTYQQKTALTDATSFIAELNQPVTLLRTQVGALPGWEGVHPFSRINDSKDLRIVPAGWQVRSPRYYRILNELGFATGSELIAGFAIAPDDGEYFVQRFNRRRGMVEFYSEQWLDYLERHHADRWLNNPQLDVVTIGESGRNPQKLSLLKLMPKSEEEKLLELLFPE